MNRRGVALLESLIALAVLSAVAVVTLTFLVGLADAWERVGVREDEMIAADRILVASSLLTYQELSQRLGHRMLCDFVVWVDRPEADLFRIGVSSAANPGRELLATLVNVTPDGATDEP